MKKYIFFCLLAWWALTLRGQSIRGSVMDAVTQEALPGAALQWMISKNGTTTNGLGAYEISLPIRTPDWLIVTYIGYVTDTILFKSQTEIHIRLKRTPELLNEVEIKDKRQATTYSTLEVLNRQSLGIGELKKAACCNLSESFETNATVDVSYSDALTGAKQIKLLGLDGSYTQILSELQPGIRGLSTNSGLAHIPGTWVQSIDITKGIGSVVNGYESMAGQINIELLKPEKADRFHLNVYAGDWGRYEANVHAAHRLNKNWSTLLLSHASTIAAKNDFNSDGFMDMATGVQYGALNRWKYEQTGKLMSDFGVFVNYDERNGGQLAFRGEDDNTNRLFYGVQTRSTHAEAYGKVAIGFSGKPYKSLGILANSRLYTYNATFGLKKYDGNEKSLHSSMVYQTIIKTSEHKLKTGISFMNDRYHESYNDSVFTRNEVVPGAFAEYNYDNLSNYSLLIGMRIDYHNLFGTLINPRAHLKINLARASVLRLSAGRGMRVANVFVEHAAVMASNRRIVVREAFKPEVSQNFGTSITHKFRLFRRTATIVADYYYTRFENQVVADLDLRSDELHFYNLAGLSYSHSAQADFVYEPVKQLELRVAYKWQDVRTTYHGILMQRPLVARSRALINIGYATRFEKWKFDYTLKWFDRMRIPAVIDHGSHRIAGRYSPDYFVHMAQITKKFKHIEWYAGGENLFAFMQHQQIADAANPFGPNFDASLIWGPVMGRVWYTGIRFTIK